MRRAIVLAASLGAAAARADPPAEGTGARAGRSILLMRDDGRDDRRTLGFDLRAARPQTSWLSWVIGTSGVLAMIPGEGGTRAAWQAVAGVGVELHPSDRVTIGGLVGVGSTYGYAQRPLEVGPGIELHVDVKVAKIRGQWLEVGAYLSHAGAITSVGVSARVAF